jgi:hypothetical protein
MKIDWKSLAQSPGYKSLKAAYMADAHKAGSVKHPMRSKEELYNTFRRAINCAKNHALRTGQPVEQVLNDWEFKRDYWWYSFYGDHKITKLPSGKPRNVRHPKPTAYIAKMYHRHSPAKRFALIKKDKLREAHHARKAAGKKPRWPQFKKRNQARYRAMQ